MTTFLAADTHLGHRLMEERRPWDTLEEHDEAIIERWNSVVRANDIVWHLGDVAMNRNKLHLAGRLNGRKKLVMGNHDTHPIAEFLEIFEEVRACKVLHDMILTHIPVHEAQLRRFGVNVHGHTHGHRVMHVPYPENGLGFDNNIDPRYICVSMEQIDYTPVSIEKIRSRINVR